MRSKLNWLWYWHITRRKRRFVPWVARKLPNRLKYYVVIDGMAYHTVVVDPHSHPDDVKGWDLLKIFDTHKDGPTNARESV